jgi:hypothetical protein
MRALWTNDDNGARKGLCVVLISIRMGQRERNFLFYNSGFSLPKTRICLSV